MKMAYEDLLNRGLIKPFAAEKAQSASRLALAKRDIKAAEAMLAIDRDWAFSMAYNAVLQATRALMFANGFRARQQGKGNIKQPWSLPKFPWGRNFRTISISSTRCGANDIASSTMPSVSFRRKKRNKLLPSLSGL